MSEHERVLRQIVRGAVQRCPQCQQAFAEADIQLVGREGENWLFSLHCHSCHTLAILGLSLVAEAPTLPTSPATEEPAPPISTDDVLDMHLFLAETPGWPQTRHGP